MNDLTEHLINMIDKKGYDNCIDEIDSLVYSPSSEDRASVSSVLCFYLNKHSEKALLHLLGDKDDYVRLEAADSIGSFKSETVFNAILKSINDEDPIIRGYLLYALAKTTPDSRRVEIIDLIDNSVSHDDSVFVKIKGLLALYYLGEKRVSNSLFELYSKCDYSDRCAIINGIADLKEDGVDVEKSFVDCFYRLIRNETLESIRSAVDYYCKSYSIAN